MEAFIGHIGHNKCEFNLNKMRNFRGICLYSQKKSPHKVHKLPVNALQLKVFAEFSVIHQETFKNYFNQIPWNISHMQFECHANICTACRSPKLYHNLYRKLVERPQKDCKL